MSPSRPPSSRVLIFAEAVTLAHVARPAALAARLDPARHEVWMAVAPQAQRFLPQAPWHVLALDSIPPARFADALRRGRPVYDRATLERYVQADLRLIDEVRPAVVVGDFRLSLSVSARLRGVPYVNVCNAYWSPYAADFRPPVPVLPWTRLIGPRAAQALFDLAWPIARVAHSAPLDAVRRRHGLSRLGPDLRRVYADGDAVAYADPPELVRLVAAPASHRFIGPILWSPPATLPAWWSDPPGAEPVVYVTMGSSGDAGLLGEIVAAVEACGCRALVATAGKPFRLAPGSRARVAAFLPGVEAARRARLVVCNGGSLTTQQAMAAGVPSLGICENMDQMLNMRAVQALGAGRMLRKDALGSEPLRRSIRALLDDDRARQASAALSERISMEATGAAFAALLETLVPNR